MIPTDFSAVGTLYSPKYTEDSSSYNNNIEGSGFIFGIFVAQVIAFKFNVRDITISFSPCFKYLFLMYDASVLEIIVEENDGTRTVFYDSEDEFSDTFKFNFGTDLIFRTERGWSYSIGLVGLLGGIVPVHGDEL